MPARKPKKRTGKAVPATRQHEIVRSYLKSLRDDPKDKKAADTLQAVSREHSVPITNLRSFVEGRNKDLPNLLVNQWAKLLGTDGGITVGRTSPVERDWYSAMLEHEQTRIARFDYYEQIDETHPEASQALHGWSDIVVTGSVGQDSKYAGGFDATYNGTDEAVKELIKESNFVVNHRLLPTEQKLMLVRDIAKYGETFEQVGVGYSDGVPGIQRLVQMPVKTMWVNTLPDGTIDPSLAYLQRKVGLPDGDPVATFPAWKIVHFKNQESRSNPYGVSVFRPLLLKWIQLEAMEAGMIIRRLERAPLRYKHTLDVGHLSNSDQIKQAKREAMEELTRRPTVDARNNFRNQRINMPPEQDWFVTKRDKDSPADVSVLEGDGNIGEITDFQHFWRVWVSGLGPPAAHLGYLDEVQRSVVSDLHIVWARKGRRMQMKFVAGLHHLHWVHMILRGYDPRTIDYTIWPPSLGTRDELMKAQVVLAYSNVVKNLAAAFGTTGQQPSIEWFLQYVMGFDQDALEALDMTDVVQQAKAGAGDTSQNPNPREDRDRNAQILDATKAGSFADQNSVQTARYLGFMMQERAVALKRPEMLSPEDRQILIPPHPLTDREIGALVRVSRPGGMRELKRVR
jgi:hypothetical protein